MTTNKMHTTLSHSYAFVHKTRNFNSTRYEFGKFESEKCTYKEPLPIYEEGPE
jgi:hypothetical protein